MGDSKIPRRIPRPGLGLFAPEADDLGMSIGAPVKVIGRPPTVVLSDELEARVAALLGHAGGRPRTAGPERIDPAIIWAEGSAAQRP